MYKEITYHKLWSLILFTLRTLYLGQLHAVTAQVEQDLLNPEHGHHHNLKYQYFVSAEYFMFFLSMTDALFNFDLHIHSATANATRH